MSNSPNISDYDYFESLVPEEEKELQKNEKLAKDFLDMIDIQRTQFVAKQLEEKSDLVVSNDKQKKKKHKKGRGAHKRRHYKEFAFTHH